jgi:DNA modification methylase
MLIAKLVADPRNAMDHDEASISNIAESLRRFGQRKNIVVTSDGVVKAGNGTLEAARRLGWTELAVGPAPPEEADARAYALADNQTARAATWNPDNLAGEVQWLADHGFQSEALESFGFEPGHISELLTHDEESPPAGGRSSVPPEELIPEPPKIPVTKLGDVWNLDGHVLICGDSFDAATRARVIDENTIDLVVTDPPYAIYGSSTGIGGDIADDRMVRPFFAAIFHACESSVKPFGHIYLCCDWRSHSAIHESAGAVQGGHYGIWPKNLIVWDKGHGLGSMYAQTHEFVAFFVKQPTPKAMKSTTKETGHRMVMKPNVFKHERAHGADRQHNAAKPPALFRWLIENSSDKGQRVVDFFGGSGTIIVAAEQTERCATVFEIKPINCDITIERWERLTGKKARRVGTRVAASSPPARRGRVRAPAPA